MEFIISLAELKESSKVSLTFYRWILIDDDFNNPVLGGGLSGSRRSGDPFRARLGSNII